MSETLKQKAAYYGYAGLSTLARVPPRPVAARLFRSGARLAHRLMSGSRAILAENLTQVLGKPTDSEEVRAAVAEAFDLYGRYWFDTFRVRDESEDWVRARVHAEGFEHVQAAQERGNGVIVAGPHLGNWDVAGHWLALQGCRAVAVAEALEPPRLLELFVQHRAELGIKAIPLVKGGGVGRQLTEYLSQNCLIGLVADRDFSGRGIKVQMFGRERTLPPGPAMLSLRTGAPLILCPIYTTPDGWSLRFHAPLEIERSGDDRADVVELTRRMAEVFERAIAAKPTDWHMFQPAWSS